MYDPEIWLKQQSGADLLFFNSYLLQQAVVFVQIFSLRVLT